MSLELGAQAVHNIFFFLSESNNLNDYYNDTDRNEWFICHDNRK